MWFYVLSLGLGGLCLVVMGVIIVRKFPHLTIINTDALPGEQSAKKKREIIQGRVTRKAAELGRRFAGAMTDRATKAGEWMTSAQARLEEMEKQYKRTANSSAAPTLPTEATAPMPVQTSAPTPAASEKKGGPVKEEEGTEELLLAAAKLLHDGQLVAAEEKYVAVISRNAKEERAYRGLAEVYMTGRRYPQALETLDFLAQIIRRDNGCRHGEGNDVVCQASAAVHADLADLLAKAGVSALAMDDPDLARVHLEVAVDMVPMSAHYLELLGEACLEQGDKEMAEAALISLRSANPDSPKIAIFEERLRALPEKN